MNQINQRLLSKLLSVFDKNIIIKLYNRYGYLNNSLNESIPKWQLEGNINVIGDNFFVKQRFRYRYKQYNRLEFNSYDRYASINFHKFLDILETKKGELLIKSEESSFDLRDLIFKDNRLYFNNILIDNDLLIDIQNNFYDLASIAFDNCTIAPNCHFSNICHQEITFDNCTIDDLSNFNYSNNNYSFSKCKINIKKATIFYSLEIKLRGCQIDFTKLFLMTTATNLKKLSIYSNDINDYSLLHFFAPNIEEIFIHSDHALNTLDFLIPLKRATSFDIDAGVHDEYYDWGAEVNVEESEKLSRRNRREIERQRIIFDNKITLLDIANMELRRIRRLNEFYKKIMVSDYEEKALKDKFNLNGIYYDLVKTDEFVKLNDGYYKSIYGELVPCYNLPEIDEMIIKKQQLILVKKFLGLRSIYKPIVLGLDYLLYLDGRPVLFDKEKRYRKQMTSTVETLNWRAQLESADQSSKLDINYLLNDAMDKLINIADELKKDYHDTKIELDESLPFATQYSRVECEKELEDVDFRWLNDLINECSEISFDHRLGSLLYQRLKEEYGENLEYFYKYIDAYLNHDNNFEIASEQKKMDAEILDNYIISMMPKLSPEEGIYLLKAFDMYDHEIGKILNTYGYNLNISNVSIKDIVQKYGNDLILLKQKALQSELELEKLRFEEITVKKEDIERLKYTQKLKKTN